MRFDNMSIMVHFNGSKPKNEKEVLNYLRRLKMYNNGAEWQMLDECDELKPHLLYYLYKKRMIDIKQRGHHSQKQGVLNDSEFYIKRIPKKIQMKLIKQDKRIFKNEISNLYHAVHMRLSDKSVHGIRIQTTRKMYEILEQKLEKHKIQEHTERGNNQ